jgi:molybdopterin molybdotransferase
MLASIGVANVKVFNLLKVGVFFTGDELTEPGQPLASGAIYNSNRYAINGLLAQLGCTVNDYGIVRDSAQATRDALSQAAKENDVIITCGGVSGGEEDHVKAAVMALGSLDLWQISMKPGKPLAYGRVGQTDFIGLPGNPVSAFVTFLLMARPFLLKRMGAIHTGLKYLTATANFDWPKPDRRREFLRVKLTTDTTGAPVLDLWPNQGSGVMSSLAWADGLVDLAPETKIARGDVLRYLSLAELLY